MTIVNDNRLKDLFEDVRQAGRDSAAGKDSLPKLAMTVCAAAAEDHPVINSKSAELIYDEYIKAESKKQIHTAAGKEANTSKLRQIINLGLGFHEEGVDLLERVARCRNELAEAGHKVLPAFQAFLNAARTQLADDHANAILDDNEVEQVCRKPEPKTKDELAWIAGQIKAAEKALNGDKNGENKFPSPQLEHVLDTYLNRQAELVQMSEDAKLAAELKKRGLVATAPDVTNDGVTPAGNELADEMADA